MCPKNSKARNKLHMVPSLISQAFGKSKSKQNILPNQSFQSCQQRTRLAETTAHIRLVSTLDIVITIIETKYVWFKCLGTQTENKNEQKIKRERKTADELNRLNIQEERNDVLNWLRFGLNSSVLLLIRLFAMCFCRASHQCWSPFPRPYSLGLLCDWLHPIDCGRNNGVQVQFRHQARWSQSQGPIIPLEVHNEFNLNLF